MITRDYIQLRDLGIVWPSPRPFPHTQHVSSGAGQGGLDGAVVAIAHPTA